jgi:hypothetical protein
MLIMLAAALWRYWIYDRRELVEVRRDIATWRAKWHAKHSKLCDWVEENIEETLTYYRLPLAHHKHMKSTNMLERFNQELKRRTHVVPHFPQCGKLPAASAGADRPLDVGESLARRGQAYLVAPVVEGKTELVANLVAHHATDTDPAWGSFAEYALADPAYVGHLPPSRHNAAPPLRDRKFADSSAEGDGFELPVPREKGWSFDGSLSSAPFKSLRVSTKTTRFLHEGPMVRIRLPPAESPCLTQTRFRGRVRALAILPPERPRDFARVGVQCRSSLSASS